MAKKENPNSPKNLIAPWMLVNMRHQYDLGNRNLGLFGKRLLTAILALAEEHSKFTEMYNWLNSQEAKLFFLSNEPEGPQVLIAFDEIQNKVNLLMKKSNGKISNEDLAAILEKYIEKHYYTFKWELKLN